MFFEMDLSFGIGKVLMIEFEVTVEETLTTHCHNIEEALSRAEEAGLLITVANRMSHL